MKILHVLPALSKGGAERVAVDLANQAVGDGHRATLLVATSAADEVLPVPLDPRVERRTIYPDGADRIARYARIPGWTAANRPWLADFDVIHCHLTFATLFGEAARRSLRAIPAARRPVIVETNHGVGLDKRRAALALFSRLLARRDAVAFMAFDPFWRRFAARHPGLPTRLIPNGVSLPEIPSQPTARAAMRERFGIPPDAPVVGTVGRMVAERRPRLYLPAFAEIDRASARRAHFVIGGAGPEVEPIRQIAAEMGLAGRVHLPGLVTDPVPLMAGLDLYFTMMVGEQAGIAALEAAALGAPVLGIQLGDEVPAEADHWLPSNRDPAALGRFAAGLMARPEALAALAERQLEYVWTHHSAVAMARAYYEFYRDAAARAGLVMSPDPQQTVDFKRQ